MLRLGRPGPDPGPSRFPALRPRNLPRRTMEDGWTRGSEADCNAVVRMQHGEEEEEERSGRVWAIPVLTIEHIWGQ